LICRYCERDCRTKLALDKHEAVCDKRPVFYDRHEQLREKCPVCKETFTYFWKREDDLWVCLKCGCVFVPRWKFAEIERIRQEEN
jgi:hypothetical protein